MFQHLNLNHGVNPLFKVPHILYVIKFSSLPSVLIPSLAFSSACIPITLSFFLYLSVWSCIYLYGLCSLSRMKAETLLDSLFYQLWFVKSQAHDKMLNCYFAMCENTWDIADNYSQSSRIFPGCLMSARHLQSTFAYTDFIFTLSTASIGRSPCFSSRLSIKR